MPIPTKRPPTTRTPRQPSTGPVAYNYNDPTTPTLEGNVPLPNKVKLPVAISGYIGGGQPANSTAGQAAACLVTIANALEFDNNHMKSPLAKWRATNVLKVETRAGMELNAFYDRASLKFFYVRDRNKNVIFAVDSADVVAHELGHAVLDIIRPDMWNVVSHEVGAFHEAFGDCHAILALLSQDKIVEYVINENGGDMSKSNVVTRMGEQMAAFLYDNVKDKTGLNRNSLRDAVNSFNYVTPETLPNITTDDKLSKEVHNFCRIWTGTFYDFIVKVYDKNKGSMGNVAALKHARDVAADYLYQGVADAPLTTRMYDSVARQMLAIDGSKGRPYRDLLLEAFHNRNILKDQLMMLNVVEFEDVSKYRGAKTYQHKYGKVVHVKKKKTMKISDHYEVMAQNYNPLYDIDVEIPMDEVYRFNQDNVLTESVTSNEDEALDATMDALDYLHKNNLVNKKESTPFEIVDGKLVRSHFRCGCRSRVDCDPNSPEYGKGLKPQNNAGCCGKGLPRPCGCDQPEPKPVPKLGCYTTVRVGQASRYKNGYNTGRKVC